MQRKQGVGDRVVVKSKLVFLYSLHPLPSFFPLRPQRLCAKLFLKLNPYLSFDSVLFKYILWLLLAKRTSQASRVESNFRLVGLVAQDIDEILLPFLQAGNEIESESLLARLIYEYADPVIMGILKRKLRVPLTLADGSYDNQNALEIVSDVHALLLVHLNRLKRQPAATSISDFRGYVAIKTYTAYNAYLRRKHPRRWRLKNRLRYLLSHRPAFTLWQSEEGKWLCGLASGRDEFKEALSAQDRGRLREHLQARRKVEQENDGAE
jgi:hypothetical protein